MEQEILNSISSYLLSKYNYYVRQGYVQSVPATECRHHHGGIFRNALFYFYDEAGNEVASYKVYAKLFQDYSKAYEERAAGRDYNSNDLKLKIWSNDIKPIIRNKAA